MFKICLEVSGQGVQQPAHWLTSFPFTTLRSVCYSTSRSQGSCYTSLTVSFFFHCHSVSVSPCILKTLTRFFSNLFKVIQYTITVDVNRCQRAGFTLPSIWCDTYNFTNKRHSSNLVLSKYRGVSYKQPRSISQL